jgi:hypothetical protein
MKKFFLLIIILSSIPFTSVAKKQVLSYKEFGALPMIEQPTVSPDGSQIISIYNTEDGPSVVLSKFGGQEITTLVKLKKAKDRIHNVYWINEERILISASYSERISDRYFRMSRLFSINTDGSNLRETKLKIRLGLKE